MNAAHFGAYPPLFSPGDLVQGTLLVVAPHPDDEVIGPGALVLAHRDAGARVVSVVMTDGAAGDVAAAPEGDYVERRRAESRAAGVVLGGTELVFLGYADGGLRSALQGPAPTPMERLRRAIDDVKPATVAFPSPFEVHPDHRATSLAVCHVARRLEGVRLLAYEVGAMLPCNVLIDMTHLLERKRRALGCFASQLVWHDLIGKMEALNRARSVNVDDRAVTHCEAYLRIEASRIAEFDAAVGSLLATIDAMAPGIPYR